MMIHQVPVLVLFWVVCAFPHGVSSFSPSSGVTIRSTKTSLGRGFHLTVNAAPKGSAATPFDKKKVAVVGAGGYLGGCIYGFLQRAAALHGTGIASMGGSPRMLTSTAFGSVKLNGILGIHFILAQADESFVKLTDFSSTESIANKLKGMDAVILATRYITETRPVTGNSYEKSPNDKTREIYMDRPKSAFIKGEDNPEFCWDLFQRSLEACRMANVRRVVVVETDTAMEVPSVADRTQYLKALQSSNIPFVYIQPVGQLNNSLEYTYAKGLQGDIAVTVSDSQDGRGSNTSSDQKNPLYREDVAAVCVQSLLSLDWASSKILTVTSNGPFRVEEDGSADGGRPRPVPLHRQWCVQSEVLAATLNNMV